MEPVILYGAPFSLFTGRARSYLIKAGIDYREEPHASEHFYESVLPKAGNRRGIPTLEFSNGDVIRDGVAIIDHFESLNGENFSPRTPKQSIVSLILDVIGAEGMLRPCMHYRWNFPEQRDFLMNEFAQVTGHDMVTRSMKIFGHGGRLAVGAQEEMGPAVEASFQDHFVKAMAIPHKSDPYANLAAAVDLPVRILTDEDAPALASGRRRGGRRR